MSERMFNKVPGIDPELAEALRKNKKDVESWEPWQRSADPLGERSESARGGEEVCVDCRQGSIPFEQNGKMWHATGTGLKLECTLPARPVPTPDPLEEAGFDDFWQFCEANAIDGAHRIDQYWRVDEVAVAYARDVLSRVKALAHREGK